MERFSSWILLSEIHTPPHSLIDYLKESREKVLEFETKITGLSALVDNVSQWLYGLTGEQYVKFDLDDFMRHLPSRFLSSLSRKKDHNFDLWSDKIESLILAIEKKWLDDAHEMRKYLQRQIDFPVEPTSYKEAFQAYYKFLQEYSGISSRMRKNERRPVGILHQIEANKDYLGQDDLPDYDEAISQVHSLKEKYDALYDAIRFYLKFAVSIKSVIERIDIAMGKYYNNSHSMPIHRNVEVLYHATIDVPGLLASGFKTRKQLGKSALGGGPDDLISFTADLKVAEAIVDGIFEIIAIARGNMSFDDIMKRTDDEFSPEYIQSLKSSGKISTSHPMDHVKADYEIDKKSGFRNHGGEREHILSAYKMYLISHPKRYDPLFWGVNLQDFANFDPSKVGIVACKVDMNQVDSYLSSMEEFRVPPSAIQSIKIIPYRSPYRF